MTYKRYENYKDSGSEWIGKVPIHWYEKKLKYLVETIKGFAFKSEVFRDNGVPIIKTTDIKQGGIVNPITFINENDINDYTNVMLKENDILMSTVGSKPEVINSAVGQIGLVSREYEGSLLNQNAVILRPKTKDINNKLLFYYLSSNNYRKYLDLNAHGTANQSSLTLKEILDFTIVIPEVIEQKKISDFLDEKTTEIDSLIKDKENLIELLKEETLAIITEAVTKGLDKKVYMKDSGIEYIGYIPSSWEVKKLRYLGSLQNGISKAAEYFGKGYPFVSYGDVYKNSSIPIDISGKVESSENERKLYSVDEGDVFFTRTSETIEEIGFASTCLATIQNATFAGFLIRFRPRSNVLTKGFSKYYFRSTMHRRFFVKEMNIVTRASLSQQLLKQLPVIIPPIDEQERIANYLDNKTFEIDSLINDVKDGINNLKEYKQSLISEVVTGKIDVRN